MLLTGVPRKHATSQLVALDSPRRAQVRGRDMDSNNTNTGKSATVGYLLWFFLGGFGAHRFYFGKTKSAIGMLCLTLGSAVLSLIVIGLVGYLALFCWWVYDAIQINKWANGPATPAFGEQPATNDASFASSPSNTNTSGDSQAA
jgi:TM2 domain-containing membrane protein YozV